MAVKREQVVQTAEKYVSRGKIEPAIREYRKLLEENPNDINTLNRVGDLYARIQRIDEAVDFFNQIAEQYAGEGFFVKAIAIYKKIIKLDPTRLDVYESLAELYHRQGLVTEARTQYQVLADYYQKHENATSAIAIYQKMAELEPANPTYHVKLAELYYQQKLTDKAMGEYRTIAELMLEHGHAQEAAQVYERALAIDCASLSFITDAATRLKESGSAPLAGRFLQMAIERNPEAEQVARQLGLTGETTAVRLTRQAARTTGVRPILAPPPPAPPPNLEPAPAPRPQAASPQAPSPAPPLAPSPPPLRPARSFEEAPPGRPPSAAGEAGAAALGREAVEEQEFDLDFDIAGDLGSHHGLPAALPPPAPEAPVGMAAPGPATRPTPQTPPSPPTPRGVAGGLHAPAVAAPEAREETGEYDLDLEDVFVLDIEDEAEPPSLVKPPPDMIAGPRRPAWAQENQEAQPAEPAAPLAEMAEMAEMGMQAGPEAASHPSAPPVPPVLPAPEDEASFLEPGLGERALPRRAPPRSSTEVRLVDPMAGIEDLDLAGAFSPLDVPFEIEDSAAGPPVPEQAAGPAEASSAEEPPGASAEPEPAALELEDLPRGAAPDSGAVPVRSPRKPGIKIDPEVLERTVSEILPPPAEREEDLVSEAEVLAKYGLQEKAIERLREALRIKPQHLGAHQLLIQLQLEKGRHARVVDLANQMSRIAAEVGDQTLWPKVRRKLLAAGFRVDGDRVLSVERSQEPTLRHAQAATSAGGVAGAGGAAAPAGAAGAASPPLPLPDLQPPQAPPPLEGLAPETDLSAPPPPAAEPELQLDEALLEESVLEPFVDLAALVPESAEGALPSLPETGFEAREALGPAGTLSPTDQVQQTDLADQSHPTEPPPPLPPVPPPAPPPVQTMAAGPPAPPGSLDLSAELHPSLGGGGEAEDLSAAGASLPPPAPASPSAAAQPAAGRGRRAPRAAPPGGLDQMLRGLLETEPAKGRKAPPALGVGAPSAPQGIPAPGVVEAPPSLPPLPPLLSVPAGLAPAAQVSAPIASTPREQEALDLFLPSQEPSLGTAPEDKPPVLAGSRPEGEGRPPEIFNPLEIGAMVESEELDWEPQAPGPRAAGAPPVEASPAAPQRAASAPPPAEGPAPVPSILDDTNMSWLDEADSGRGADATSSRLFEDEDNFFDLAGELEQELSKEAAFQGEDVLMAQAEQSLEEIVEGFKRGVAEHLSPTDYDTHFNLGIAYREMGLLDEAIGEFQLAAKDDRYLVSCCSMLGLCFLDKGLPELAIKWYRRGLDTPGLGEDDTLGLLYDLGCVYVAMGDTETAYKTFVEVYGINTNYRDVVARIEELGHPRPH